MKIEIDNPATATLHDSDCMGDGYQAEFNDDGIARVKEAVGTALAEKYPRIEAVEEESPPPPEDGTADSDADGEATDDNSDTNEVEGQ